MSVKVMGWVWDADLPKDEKFVLLAYADHADHEGGSIHPSAGLVAHKTGYTKRGVQAIKARLISQGIMVQYGTTKQGIPIYYINKRKVPTLPERHPSFKKSPQKQEEGVNQIQGGGESDSPKPSYNRQENHHVLEPSDELFAELVSLLDVPVKLIKPKTKTTWEDFVLDLQEIGAKPGDLKAFGEWWYENDWRGKKNQKPSLDQIRVEWNSFVNSNGTSQNGKVKRNADGSLYL